METRQKNTLKTKDREFCGVSLVFMATLAISKLAELIL